MVTRSLPLRAAIALLSLPALGAWADPTLSSWMINTSGTTGQSAIPTINSSVSKILADVQQVRYTDSGVYINATDVPDYSVGPFGADPNIPSDQHALWDIPRNPQVQSGTKTPTGLGPIGVLVNGVSVYNAKDANSYNNQNIWHSNAVLVEGADMDAALGHPDQSGSYHHHQHPAALMNELGDDGTHPSPILGYAFDGYPIYGPYMYANADGTGGVVRMTSSFQLRTITQRTTLPNGTALSPSQYGPAVSAQYPLGYYVEDYQFVPGSGLLDQYNGRFTVTPEYPGGTYAYFATVDAAGNSAYPYMVGPQYYGVVSQDDLTRSVTVPAGAQGVPEAGSLGLLGVSGLLLLVRRRRP